MPQVKVTTPTEITDGDEVRAGSGTPRLDGIRVLVLFGGAELFGQERANIEVFRSLMPVGLRAKFVTSSKWGRRLIQPALERFGIEWMEAPFGYHWTRHMLGKHFGYFLLNLYGVMATSWSVWRQARRWRATHIYAPNWIYWLYAAPALRWLGLPFIFRAGDQLPSQTKVHKRMKEQLVNKVSLLVCNCEFLQQRFLAYGLNPEKIRVIYNFPAARYEGQGGNSPTLPTGNILALYVGQLSEHKGVAVLVEAAGKLLQAGRQLTVWIAGGSVWSRDESERLQRQVESNGWSEQIQFLGYRTDVSELMRRADMHVCPSLWEEPSPNVVFEAKQEGVPSVVFPMGGIPELVEHRVDGYVCRGCTAEALVEGIDYFLQDAARRKRAGEAARRSLEERFGFERFQRQWAEVFLETVQKPTSRNDQLP